MMRPRREVPPVNQRRDEFIATLGQELANPLAAAYAAESMAIRQRAKQAGFDHYLMKPIRRRTSAVEFTRRKGGS